MRILSLNEDFRGKKVLAIKLSTIDKYMLFRSKTGKAKHILKWKIPRSRIVKSLKKMSGDKYIKKKE